MTSVLRRYIITQQAKQGDGKSLVKLQPHMKTTSIHQLFHCQAHTRDDHKQLIDYLRHPYFPSEASYLNNIKCHSSYTIVGKNLT